MIDREQRPAELARGGTCDRLATDARCAE